MGVYIELIGVSKEQWLEENGTEILHPNIERQPDELPVCLIDNGLFRAACITWNETEVLACSVPGDPRPKKWYAVKRDLLRPFMGKYIWELIERSQAAEGT